MYETSNSVAMFLNGTAMSGLKDHVHILGSRFIGERRTVPRYRLYSVRDEFPGLVPVERGGVTVWGELYEMDRSIVARSGFFRASRRSSCRGKQTSTMGPVLMSCSLNSTASRRETNWWTLAHSAAGGRTLSTWEPSNNEDPLT